MDDDDASLKRSGRVSLGSDSERLLRAVEELRELEREKRRHEIRSRPFYEVARRLEAKAREVFRIANQETDGGDVIEWSPEVKPTEQAGSPRESERASVAPADAHDAD